MSELPLAMKNGSLRGPDESDLLPLQPCSFSLRNSCEAVRIKWARRLTFLVPLDSSLSGPLDSSLIAPLDSSLAGGGLFPLFFWEFSIGILCISLLNYSVQPTRDASIHSPLALLFYNVFCLANNRDIVTGYVQLVEVLLVNELGIAVIWT
mmetsp:Transcript_18211/g.39701  ORF Transcript_18211/g.39701 Transcript_18211/m.39701 type:complete len:151 (-) Transcript_18211:254-706(-)